MDVINICFLLILILLITHKKSNEGLDSAPTALDTCNKISSRADDIAAQYSGAKEIIDSINPMNWFKSGSNTEKTIARQIIDINMSTTDQTNITNTCNQSSVTAQSNVIDNSNCEYCKKNLCTISGTRQSNVSEDSQKCTIESMIQLLMQKKSDIDAQALSKAIQKASGLLSGSNSSSTDTCQNIKEDLSSKNYLDAVSACYQTSSLDQKNLFQFCGNSIDNIQTNNNKNIKDCVLKATTDIKSSVVSSLTTVTNNSVNQDTSGLDLSLGSTASLAGFGISIFSVCIVISIVMLSLND